MKNRFLAYTKDLISPADKVLLTISGGVDSMVMLHLFRQSSFKIGIAHCNFQLRGKEANEDEALVQKTAEEYDIPFYSIHFDTKSYAQEHDISIQMAARDLRYAWFQEIADKHAFNCVVTAHHRDDVLETFFVNMLRKTGIKGLTGIKPISGNLVRPLLAFSKKEIMYYALENNITYREDQSNSSDYYLRNYIRLHIIPEFRKLQENFDDTLSETICILNKQETVFSKHIEDVKKKIMTYQNNLYIIDIQKLKKTSEPSVYLFEILYPLGFNASQIDKILLSLDHESGKQFISETHRVLKDRDKLFIQSHTDDYKTKNEYIDNDFVNNKLVQHHLTLELIPYHQDFHIENALHIAYFDADNIKYPLVIRKWRHGDFFYPFGMKGKKKISDYFSDYKLSLFEKETKEVLCNANGDILWLIGLRTDNRYRIISQTKQVLKITYSQSEN